MNYQALKTMIEWIINNHTCPYCQSKINWTNIDIIWAAGNNVNIDIECPNCKKHSIVKSQVIQLDAQNIQKLKNNLDIKSNKSIKDSEISELSKDLKTRKLTVEDLLN